ncbi:MULTISPECIES: flavodoxin domain-containing protein [unclassified Mesorhizobium]|uniref:flavodoxin domain-containing protein n=1 Tax=unclassified Mesorhizobium TaxID=325217 RepID=UPI000464C99E|nr:MULTISPECIES: flavodoxin domain-containing protein [unclassified Mesorhizobium]
MIKVLFGTESGNSEMAADDIAALLSSSGAAAEVVPMEDADVQKLTSDGFVIIITSTYGDGELPETTQPFYNSLYNLRPDLSNLRFAAFGLGDSSYETYGNGIDLVAGLLVELGAKQIGKTGRYDAAKAQELSVVAAEWTNSVASELTV